MRRGAALAVLAALLVSGALPYSQGATQQGRLLVDQEGLAAGEKAVVHVVVDPRSTGVEERVEILMVVEGPEHTVGIERSAQIGGGGPQLVSVPWAPEDAGTHHLDVDARVSGGTVDVAERTVYVSPAREGSASEGLPDPAPGTLQWAIVVAGLYLFFRNSRGG